MTTHAISPSPGTPAIEARHVRCTYGDYAAVDDVSLQVPVAGIHALLGTNGAGKTTLLETLQGLRRPRSGQVQVLGHDPATQRAMIAARTGTMLQESGLVDQMTVHGQLSLWQALNLRSDRISRVLDLVGLQHRRGVPVSVLSGGEKRRLDFAMALWGEPDLVILDEPTVGLDPQSRQTMWSVITDLNARGTTVLLTTHYLEEAQRLADTVTILHEGRVARGGSMVQILAAMPASISFTVSTDAVALTELESRVGGELASGQDRHEDQRLSVQVRTTTPQDDIGAVVDWARRHTLDLHRLRCAPASLEDVFLDVPAVDPAGGRALDPQKPGSTLRGTETNDTTKQEVSIR